MTKAVVIAIVAIVLGFTASPADARPMKSKGEHRVEPVAACARIVMTDDGERADCTEPTYCTREDYREHRTHGGRKHAGSRHFQRRHHCLTRAPLASLR